MPRQGRLWGMRLAAQNSGELHTSNLITDTTSMTVVAWADARDAPIETAPSRSQWGGSHYPYPATGVIEGECTVVCVECAEECEHNTPAAFRANEEYDYPGLTCRECERVLEGTLLIYDSGPGSHLLEGDIPDWVHVEDESVLED